jgi:flagellar protein FlaG|tara:strand:- start:214 stop:588 length:375 start_codon:yes stop_codon:yes gene_type:complete
MANISMSNPLPPPSINRVVQREVGKAAAVTVAKPTSAESNAPGKQKLEGVPSSKLNELQQLTEQAFVADDLRLSISFEKSIGRFVYRGIDRKTGEVVREYPQEEVVKRIAHLREIAGIAIDRSL